MEYYIGLSSPFQKKKNNKMLTIDIEAVLVQSEGSQLGDTVSLMAQFPVQPLSV